jgi:hypothetical protein
MFPGGRYRRYHLAASWSSGLASTCVTQGLIERRNLKHEMSQSFSYWHVTVSRPVSFRFGQCGRGSAHYLANRARSVALVVCCEW